MDHQTPPIAALQNLTINTKPTPTPSRQESYKRAYLNALLTQWYKPSTQETRMHHSRFRTFQTLAKRAKMTTKMGNVVEYTVVGERITRLLCNMADDKPEFRDRLELAIRYVQLRENHDQVLSIIKSLY
ncbi:hypothetical protein POM88_029748 [Heracleum sosnowskyi]|uniref:Uncharacterized protein n=1 Tax=Heracleum sosnowskyi TaxID=360622 RepID=A0AAD8HX40_9APIA|nr:hypothetical protein POM88_029748 [Heracleum sosnowskyi]